MPRRLTSLAQPEHQITVGDTTFYKNTRSTPGYLQAENNVSRSPNRFELQHIRLTNSNPLLRPLMICRMSTTLESATVKNETPDYGSVAYWDERCVRVMLSHGGS